MSTVKKLLKSIKTTATITIAIIKIEIRIVLALHQMIAPTLVKIASSKEELGTVTLLFIVVFTILALLIS